jgi:N-acetylneuraminate synthase
MSTMNQIQRSIEVLGLENMMICHTTSAYPCDPDELNLRMLQTLAAQYPCPIGYSGHEVGLIPTVVAVALGACLVERHFTLDRAMWGSDQAASVEPGGFERLVKYIRVTELSLGDGVKRVYDSELPILKKLRRVTDE